WAYGTLGTDLALAVFPKDQFLPTAFFGCEGISGVLRDAQTLPRHPLDTHPRCA
ncbi:uncharacterized protein METZ01_LOCUS345541, partial [marine metagenome]